MAKVHEIKNVDRKYYGSSLIIALRESLKLSNELNSNYENKIKDLETTIEIIRRENKELKRGVR